MRNICFIALLLFLLSFSWGNDMDSAIEEAKSNQKNILINYSGSDWCIPCKKMKKLIFQDSTFIKFADSSVVLVNIDFPTDDSKMDKSLISHNEKWADKYNPEGIFPYTILINAEGEVLSKWIGYRGMKSSEFIESIQQIQK